MVGTKMKRKEKIIQKWEVRKSSKHDSVTKHSQETWEVRKSLMKKQDRITKHSWNQNEKKRENHTKFYVM